jgi:hypothetical protein
MGQVGTIGLASVPPPRLLDLEVRAIEFIWKREEEIARIIDQELTPRRLLEAHIRRLPIRLRPSGARRTVEAEGR